MSPTATEALARVDFRAPVISYVVREDGLVLNVDEHEIYGNMATGIRGVIDLVFEYTGTQLPQLNLTAQNVVKGVPQADQIIDLVLSELR